MFVLLLSYSHYSAALLTMMGHDPATVVQVNVLTAHATPVPIRHPVSLLHLTQSCLDFWAIPRRYFFELRSQYCRCFYSILHILTALYFHKL